MELVGYYEKFYQANFRDFCFRLGKRSLSWRSLHRDGHSGEKSMSDKYSRISWICVMLLALWSPTAALANDKHPLEPQDLSSPKATLNTFLKTGDLLYRLLRDEYWHAPSRAVVDRLGDYDAELERMLDLSGIPPAARFELGRDGIHYLYEVLSRIELPAEADISDAAA
jgi:hypothetical protein